MIVKTLWLEQRLQVTLEPSFGSPGGKVRHFLWQNLWQLILDLLVILAVSDAKRNSATSFSNAVTLLLNWKTDAKSGSVDGGFIASVVGGGVDVDC
ncbi:hypothetical protein Tco_1048042 [Tanacetum coccineum]